MACLCLITAAVAIGAFLYWFVKRDCNTILHLYNLYGKEPETLKDKVVWISGASSGIGESLAYILSKAGVKLVLSATREAKLEEVKKNCLKKNGRIGVNDILVLPLDVSKLDMHQQAFDKIIEHFGALDVFVNNAARIQFGHFTKTDTAVVEDLFRVNVIGGINLTKIVVNYWLEKKQQGHLVVTSSLAGFMGIGGMAAYCATKHALHGYYDSLRNELSFRGISVSIFCPGPVNTELGDNAMWSHQGQKREIKRNKAPRILPMTSDRCAELLATVIANKIQYSWAAIQPYLTASYIFQYLPSTSKFLSGWFSSEERVEKLATCSFD